MGWRKPFCTIELVFSIGGLTVEELPLLVAVDPVELLLPVGLRLYVAQDNHAAQATYEGLGMQRVRYQVMQDLFG